MERINMYYEILGRVILPTGLILMLMAFFILILFWSFKEITKKD